MERMFRKNFQDEIQRLNDDEILDDAEPGTMIDGHSVRKSVSSHYQQSLHDAAGSRRKGSQVPTKTQRSPFVIPPLQLGRTELDPSPVSPVPRSSRPNSITSIPKVSGSKQTPLQKHLAQLARYGMNAVSSGPGDRSINGNSDTQSDPGSPRNSIENASEPVLGAAAISGVSLAASHQGSVNSHQLRGRFSRFGSGFNFGQRRDGTLNN
jgi:dedicator of cytokinesis protein 3